MLSKISELQARQVINIADGKCLGNIKDIELDWEQGTIRALILPNPTSLWGLLQNKDELIISWQQVVRIGVDVVLVDIKPQNDNKNRRSRKGQNEEKWQTELAAYQDELALEQPSQKSRKMVLHLQ